MDNKELDRLCEIIGSLVIAQFDTQDEYRETINMNLERRMKIVVDNNLSTCHKQYTINQ